MAREFPKNSKFIFHEGEAKSIRANYDYPNGIDLNPTGEVHRKLLEALLTDATAASDVVKERFPVWKELDRKLSVYIDLSNEDRKTQQSDDSKPVSIVVPLSYATRETLLTYYTAAFLNQPPLHKYEPSADPKDTIGVLLLENIVQQNMIKTKGALNYHTMWSDAFTYGVGGIATGWKKSFGFRTRKKSIQNTILGIPTGEPTIESIQEQVIHYEGNDLSNIDPYNMLPDPNVAITNIQEGEYFGWVDASNYISLLREEQAGEGDVFNVKFLAKMQDKTSSYFYKATTDSGRYDKQGGSIGDEKRTGDPAHSIYMYKWIIPEEFKIGSGSNPELWMFRVASDRVIIEARPLGLDHNQIPVGLMSPDSDGHTSLPVSILEREYPLQHAIDWLWKSHVANVRKAVNNMFVVDPSLIDTEDVADTKFGMLARIRPSAWGRGVRDAIEQLPVQDVTKGHISDIGFLMGLDSKVFTSDQAKGFQERGGERVSAQEARDTRMSFLSKMEKSAKLAALQAHQDIGYQLAANTIQLLENDEYVKITGDYENVLTEEFGIKTDFLKVKPQALDVRYDVVPASGSIQGGEFADTWVQLINTAAGHPETFDQLDFTRVFKHVARLLGAKNINDFMKTPITSKVADQAEIEKGVQSGNFAPANEVQGGDLR